MPDRIQLRRKKGWRKPPGAVVVARPAIWGNPFTRQAAQEAGYAGDNAMLVAAFRDWLLGRDHFLVAQDRRAEVLRRLPELRGKDLACWCPPGEPCHADILLEIANA